MCLFQFLSLSSKRKRKLWERTERMVLPKRRRSCTRVSKQQLVWHQTFEVKPLSRWRDVQKKPERDHPEQPDGADSSVSVKPGWQSTELVFRSYYLLEMWRCWRCFFSRALLGISKSRETWWDVFRRNIPELWAITNEYRVWNCRWWQQQLDQWVQKNIWYLQWYLEQPWDLLSGGRRLRWSRCGCLGRCLCRVDSTTAS